MIRKLSLLMQKYKNERNLIEDKLSFKEMLLYTLYSVILTVLILLIPGLIIYNLFIIDKLTFILKALIILLVILFSYLYSYLFTYIAKLNNESLKNRKFNNLTIFEGTIFATILTILVIVVMQIL